MDRGAVTQSAFTITVYDGTVGASVLDEIVALYAEVYSEPPYFESEDDFVSFTHDLPKRAAQESFRLVTARCDTRAVGFALGHRLTQDTRWWDGAVEAIPEDIASEHVGRTFAIIELAVSLTYRRRHIARRLHAHLTTDLAEERVTLLVRPDATPARAAYDSWRYKTIGQIRPFPNGPIYNALLKDTLTATDRAS